MCEQCDELGIPHGSSLGFGITKQNVIMAVVFCNDQVIDNVPVGPCNEETLQHMEAFIKETRHTLMMESAVPTGKVN
ncbi:hypothetical protein RIVERRIDER_19 [Xanthomonas phage RiverRider]|uniref:Uncharacterized protein n=1 Tax=Xanthomonas phage RiverRider TaxID=2108116 RepID=A0A2P1JUR9_9CAUD|nr:hypothetical protein HWB58_gp19 [Xanthomonas phage RiverRider]AVO23107.1 hypothetical protein RIVERRIDER_19 [Xanthomonas phage RiverRider]